MEPPERIHCEGERVPCRLVPAESRSRETELLERGAQVFPGRVFVDGLAVAAKRWNDEASPASPELPIGKDGQERIENRDDPQVR